MAKLECSLEIRWQKCINVNFLILMVELPLYNVFKRKESGGGAGNGPSGCNLLSYDLWGGKNPTTKNLCTVLQLLLSFRLFQYF